MKRLTILLATMLAACVSVPRDAGLSEVTARAIPQVQTDADGLLSADEAVAVAMANNPRLQVALAELGIARADLIEASTISNPVFEFELRVPGEPYRPYELRLAQSLIELITLPRRRALGRAAFDAAQLGVTTEVLRFGADVRSTYFDVVAATQHVAQSRTILEAARAAAEVAIKQHAAENITDLDLENEQALYEQAKLDLARAERQVLVAREALVRSMGLPDGSPGWRVPDRFPQLPENELDPQELEPLAAQQRLDIAIARRELDIAQRRVPLARLAVLGDVEIDVHYEREPSGEHTIGPGIELPIPIFDTGRAARTRAEAQFLRAKHTLDALLLESSSRLRTAHATLAEARARVEYYRDVILPRRRRIVELTKLEHNAMLVGVFQLLQARQNEARAESDFIEAQREYWSARTDLDRALQGIARESEGGPSPSVGRRMTGERGGH
ncbi:MAG: TolC family protein [Thermoanaerobaculia bacterium]